MSSDDGAFERALWISRACLAVSLVLGLVAMAMAAAAWPDLPERLPTHFNAAGEPDGWARRSVGSVFILPAMAMLLGPAMVLLALMMAAPAHRPPKDRTDLRAAMPPLAIFLAILAVFTSVLLGGIAMGSTRVALGRSASIGWWPMAGGIALGLWAIGGAIYFVAKHSGIGGSGGRSADPARWKWGVFYVAPDDPSLFVEKRWGGGYTINFGLPAGRRIAWGMLAFFLLMMGMVAVAVLSS